MNITVNEYKSVHADNLANDYIINYFYCINYIFVINIMSRNNISTL